MRQSLRPSFNLGSWHLGPMDGIGREWGIDSFQPSCATAADVLLLFVPQWKMAAS
jgi:hypothetical protein